MKIWLITLLTLLKAILKIVGRTTTFMIMYDIIKNGNNVSLNDIIGRQVLLSGISQRDAVDFYVGNRYDFLSNFYDKYKGCNSTFSNYNSINSTNLSNKNISLLNCSYNDRIEYKRLCTI